MWDEVAEVSVLGGMLTDERCITEVLDVLEPAGEAKFYKASHGRVYAVVRGLWAEGRPADPLVVAGVLGSEWHGKLAEFVASSTSTANIGTHAGLVREQWVRREVAAAANRLLGEAQNGSPVEAARRILSGVEDLVVRERESSVKSMSDLVAELVSELQERDGKVQGFAPPLACLPVLVPGRVYVVGGYTGQGKTALAVQWAAFLASRQVPTTFHTLEMSAGDIRNRFLAQQGVPIHQVQSGRVESWDHVLRAGAESESWPLRVVDDPSVLAADVLRYQRGIGAKVVFLDHLHQMEVKASHGEHRLALNRELRQFVALAKNERVAVVLLAQLNRPQGVSETLPRPTLRSLKESGAIEENAAYVGFVWRKLDEDGVVLPYAEWICAKDRFGAVRPPSVLRFNSARLSFEESVHRV